MSQAIFGPYIECSLDLAVDVVNTYDPISGRDDLQTMEGLQKFVDANMSEAPPPTEEDREHVLQLRTLLRQVFEADDERTAADILNMVLGKSDARPVLTDHDGPWHLHYSALGSPLAPRLAAECAMALSVVIADGGFDRLSTCDSETCADVFVDQSRNNSRRYCSPSVCGNRASVAAFRARQRAKAAKPKAKPAR